MVDDLEHARAKRGGKAGWIVGLCVLVLVAGALVYIYTRPAPIKPRLTDNTIPLETAQQVAQAARAYVADNYRTRVEFPPSDEPSVFRNQDLSYGVMGKCQIENAFGTFLKHGYLVAVKQQADGSYTGMDMSID